MTTESIQTLIPKLTKDNYDSWCIRLKAFLGSQECLEIVHYGYDEPESKEEEDALQEAQKQALKVNRKKDNKAKTIIYQGLDEDTFEIIASAETSKDIWEALQQKYKGADRIKKIRLQSLRGEFELLQMKSSESISDYHTRIMVIVNQMRRNGEAIVDSRITEKILRSLDPKFDFVVVAIEESKEVDKLTVDELMSSLQAHEQKIVKRNGDKAIEHALQAKLSLKDRYEQGETSTSGYTTQARSQQSRGGFQQFQGRGSWNTSFRGRGGRNTTRGGRGQQAFTPRGRGGGYNNRDKRNIQCYSCNQFGHYSTECKRKAPLEIREQANYAEKDDREEAAFLVQQELGEKQENIWYLDTGASNHMCGYRELFGDLDETKQGLVTFGDTSKVPFKGKGSIPIKLKNGDSSYIANVYYVPAIKQNLISLGQLMERGYTFYSKNCHLTIRDNNWRLMAYGKMSKNRMFPLNIQYDAAKCLSAITYSEEWL